MGALSLLDYEGEITDAVALNCYSSQVALQITMEQALASGNRSSNYEWVSGEHQLDGLTFNITKKTLSFDTCLHHGQCLIR